MYAHLCLDVTWELILKFVKQLKCEIEEMNELMSGVWPLLKRHVNI